MRPSTIVVRVVAARFALLSAAPFVANAMMLRVPYMLSDSHATPAPHGVLLDASLEMAATVMHVSRGEVQALLIIGLALAAGGLIASWPGVSIREVGRQSCSWSVAIALPTRAPAAANAD